MFGSTMMMNDCLVVSSDDCHVYYILSFDVLHFNKRKHADLGVRYIYIQIAYRICHDLQLCLNVHVGLYALEMYNTGSLICSESHTYIIVM
jgi:hypothetical protein